MAFVSDPELEPRPRNAPPGHWPDFTTYYLRYPVGIREVVRVTIGAEGDDASGFIDRAVEALRGPDAPLTLERGRVMVPADPHTEILFAYWDDLDAHRRWSEGDACGRLFDAARPAHWRETAFLPLTHTETHFAQQTRETGLGRVPGTQHAFCPMVGYWGSARDRIPVAADDALEPGSQVPAPRREGDGELSVVAPANICTIRTSQDWQ